MKKNKSNNAWKNISKDYSKLLIPNRPSQDDCHNYGLLINKVLKNKNKPKIMIMGSTPELRRILYTYEFLQKVEVFCLDVNELMYKAMANFIMKANFNERFLKRSWLDTKLKDKTFDLIVGDEVICNIDKKEHNNFFKEVCRILKDNGAWITRHNFYTEQVKKTNVKKILLNLAEKINKGEYCFQQADNILYNNIFYYESSVNQDSNTTINHLKIIKREYKQSFENHKLNKIIKKLIGIYENKFVSMCGDYKWHVLSEKESECELSDYFIIKKKVYSMDYPSVKYSPIYLLKKKKIN